MDDEPEFFRGELRGGMMDFWKMDDEPVFCFWKDFPGRIEERDDGFVYAVEIKRKMENGYKARICISIF